MNDTDTGQVCLELAVRTLAPEGMSRVQRTTIERMRELERRGVVEETTVTVWGERVGLDTPDADTDHGQMVLETVDSFREWAAETDVSVAPFFETQTVESGLTGEEYTALELPGMVLAEYQDGDLERVSPCIDGEQSYTVADHLDTLSAAPGSRITESATGSPTVLEEAEE